MTIRFLALYIAGVLAVACFGLMLITVVPEAEPKRDIAWGVCAVGAIGYAAFGMSLGRLSPQHWVNRSRALQSSLTVIAAGLTLFLLFGVVG
jgi:hypothetical protein